MILLRHQKILSKRRELNQRTPESTRQLLSRLMSLGKVIYPARLYDQFGFFAEIRILCVAV